MFDFQHLVNSLVNNNQFRLPPEDVMRMGKVTGYDPNFKNLDDGTQYPTVSVAIGGDAAPMHGLRFSEGYTPNIGDTVMCVQSGEDMYVLHAFSGSNKDTLHTVRSAVGLLAHSTVTVPASVVSAAKPATVYTTILPNRLYRIEVTAHFTSKVVGANSKAEVTVTAPNGKLLHLGTAQVSQGADSTFSGSALWWDSGNPKDDEGDPFGATALTDWVTKYPQKTGQNPQGKWIVNLEAVQYAGAGAWAPTNSYEAGQVVSVGTGKHIQYYVAKQPIAPYDASTYYAANDAVVYKSPATGKYGTYIAKIPSRIVRGSTINIEPGDTTSGLGTWDLLYPVNPTKAPMASPARDARQPNGNGGLGKVWKIDTKPEFTLADHTVSVTDMGIRDPQPYKTLAGTVVPNATSDYKPTPASTTDST